MKEAYLLIKPEHFTMCGGIDINGDYPRKDCDSFGLDEPFNNLMFRVKYTNRSGRTYYSSRCREVYTGMKFNLDIKGRTDYSTGKQFNTIELYSKKSGLQSDELPLKSVLIKPSKASAIEIFLENDPERKKTYLKSLKKMICEARDSKYAYDHSVNGLSRLTLSIMRNEYNRTRIGKR